VLDAALVIAFALVSASMLMVLVRLLRGPTLSDRILALDTLYVNAVALVVLLGIWEGDDVHFEAVLIIAMLGFAGSVAFARFALRREVLR
jgi:multicomponent K+:H+ antiporter subunit F